MRTLVCLATLLASGIASAAAPTPRLAVVSLDAPPDLTFTGKSLSDAIADEARHGGGFEVMGPDAVERTLGREGTVALVRCADDARCVADRAARLGVEHVVAGWIQASQDRYSVTLVHVDVGAHRRVAWVRRDVPIASRKLRADVLAAVPGLLSGEADRQGTLDVEASVKDATVTVDERIAGTTPLHQQLPPGRHKVQVSKAGYAAADPVWVDVPAGGRAQHVQRLYEIPPRDRPNKTSTAAAH
ncbi:PEGA domain-containing protein [Anaeromyxobacter oryzae]|uniref:PEGA domain-containing protein n=1 Tax=Anaeromyxobacter oryzae TaxID=2918170 RepID=A0ABN6MQM3_9BACT|nr:PEGA domain-containing protein [Anaeromyxobacter oryzae]BDG03291.1 hypothetical protein AMOR_22870 [Anaeromyxobacter oryzae]